MTDPISGPSYSAPLPSHAPHTQDVPLLCKQMQSQTTTLADQLKQLQNDPSLATQESFLREVAKNGEHLNSTVEKSILVR